MVGTGSRTTRSAWNFADIWEAVATRSPREPALHHGDHTVSWADVEHRAEGLARALVARGLPRQGKVAQYLRNRPEYLESLFAIFKAALVPVNTNYRYGDDELAYLWSNSDTGAVLFESDFDATVERLVGRLPGITTWIRVGPRGTCPDWAEPYEDVVELGHDAPAVGWRRSGDDLYLLYTGGTTGAPKGVMWRQDDLFVMLEASQGGPPVPATPDVDAYVNGQHRASRTVLPAAPLMHGTATWFALPAWNRGGAVVTLPGRSLDVDVLLDTMVSRRVGGLCVVGEVFVRPMVTALEARPGRWDLRDLRVVLSSGAALSEATKGRLLAFAPRARIVDGLGTSESGTLGAASTTTTERAETTRFRLEPNVRVIDDEGRDVAPGSTVPGRLAVSGHIPLGYYGDPEKTAATFVHLDGVRHVVAGDVALVNQDGTITLIGRGSSCINTGGEKVFPEEVEDVLRDAPGVRDVVVVGVPDERLGQMVTALVESEVTASVSEADLIAYVRSRLAAYKAPRRVHVVPSIDRGPNGKVDRGALQQTARALGTSERPLL